MKFSAAILKLTFFYVLVIMVISVSFSLAIFQISSNEIGRGLGRQANILHDLPSRDDFHLFDDFETLRQQQTEESIFRLKINLVYYNLLILILSTVGSYFFARFSLRPLEEAMEEQNRFTADASHELKTPLAALRSEIEVNLRDKNFSIVQAKKLFKSNLEEIEKLESLSGALLKLSRFDEANKIEFRNIKIGEVIEIAYKKVESLAKKKSIDFVMDFFEVKVLGDRQSLVELLVILFDNAIKYNPKNSKISVSTFKEQKYFVVKVKDLGNGIKNSDLPHIFDRFYRADQSRNKVKADGYGLGLSIAKRIVELHSGQISVVSTLGKGSEFIIKLPLV